MNSSELHEPADALREFCETLARQAEKIAAAVFESAEKMAEELAPLIEEAAEVLAKILPLAIEEVRSRAAYRPSKKDAPRKLGEERKIRQYPKPRYCARSRI